MEQRGGRNRPSQGIIQTDEPIPPTDLGSELDGFKFSVKNHTAIRPET